MGTRRRTYSLGGRVWSVGDRDPAFVGRCWRVAALLLLCPLYKRTTRDRYLCAFGCQQANFSQVFNISTAKVWPSMCSSSCGAAAAAAAAGECKRFWAVVCRKGALPQLGLSFRCF